mgnify:CR=1 FL=1
MLFLGNHTAWKDEKALSTLFKVNDNFKVDEFPRRLLHDIDGGKERTAMVMTHLSKKLQEANTKFTARVEQVHSMRGLHNDHEIKPEMKKYAKNELYKEMLYGFENLLARDQTAKTLWEDYKKFLERVCEGPPRVFGPNSREKILLSLRS